MLSTASGVAERISSAEDALAEAGAEVLTFHDGRVIRQPSFPHVYDANLVRRARLREATLDASLERFASSLREVGARHLQLSLDGADVPESVAALLPRRGFVRDRLVGMVLDRTDHERRAHLRAEGVTLRAVPDEGAWESFAFAMDCMNREEPWYAPSVSLEIVGSMRTKSTVGPLRLFVAEHGSRIVGTIGLALTRRTATIVSVGTLPAWRGRGVARTMICDVLARAHALKADLSYLIARADDSPKEMYRKLGFRTEIAFDSWLRLPR